ncbi:MAG: TonB family protein [Pyrinomonadaceae bacterium]
MKWLATALLIALFALTVFAQPDQVKLAASNDKWIRVVSDDGEFSIEVPEQYHYFLFKEGFSVHEPGSGSDYEAKEMRSLKAFVNGTLVGFESYKAKKGALKAFFKLHNSRKSNIIETEIKNTDFSIRQAIIKESDHYLVRQYFYSKKNIYILTAASRNPDAPVIKRFLNSLVFSPKSAQSVALNGEKISSLRVTWPQFDSNPKVPRGSSGAKIPTPPLKNEDDKSLILLSKPYPRYTTSARQANVEGTIILRVTFSAEGYISRIFVLRELPEGLLQQAMLAAMRIDFLPAETNGKAKSVTKTIEYSFDVY